jgi:hypothetical protein
MLESCVGAEEERCVDWGKEESEPESSFRPYVNRCFGGASWLVGWMEATVQSVQDTQAVVKFQQESDKVGQHWQTWAQADRQRLLKSMIGQWTARVVAVKSLELDMIEKRDGAILQYVKLLWESP